MNYLNIVLRGCITRVDHDQYFNLGQVTWPLIHRHFTFSFISKYASETEVKSSEQRFILLRKNYHLRFLKT